MLDAFRDHVFRGHTLSLVTALRDIATEYAAQGMRLTVRQLYYQCVARGWIENNEREYQKIIRILTDAREAGLFDWDAIEDRGREVVMRTCWESPADILSAAASSYPEDRWNTQDTRVVVVLKLPWPGSSSQSVRTWIRRYSRRSATHRLRSSTRLRRNGYVRRWKQARA
jgi:hypothetical protein